jgi:hypothetical protein
MKPDGRVSHVLAAGSARVLDMVDGIRQIDRVYFHIQAVELRGLVEDTSRFPDVGSPFENMRGLESTHG